MAKVSVGSRARSAVQESDANPQAIYAAALLRLALRLKRGGPAGRPNWDELVEQALGRSSHELLDRPAFRGYLKRNYSFLLASLGQKNS